MARDELARIRDEAVARFGLAGLVIHHQTGALRVGGQIVLVAAAGRRRQAAVKAAAWTMDRIKGRVPLWKREHGPGARWVEGSHSSLGS